MMLWPEIRTALSAERAVIGTINRQAGRSWHIAYSDFRSQAQMARALEITNAQARPVTTLSGAGSNNIDVSAEGDVIVVVFSEAEKLSIDTRTMDQSLEIIRRRVDEAGTREPTIQRQGSDRI